MKHFSLRHVDPELWKRLKHRAASEGRTIRFVLIELIRVYADHGYHVVETFDGKHKK